MADGMNLRQMEVFRAVMLTGTVSGAAQLLHISQPAASKLLTLSERRSGIRLFERVKGRLIATPDAHRLYTEVEAVWEAVERASVVSRALANPQSGTLCVVASPSLGIHVVPRTVVDLLARYPTLNVRVDLLVPHDLVAALVNGVADVGVAMLAADHPNLVTIASYQSGLVCVMHENHPLAAKRTIRPEDLRGQRLISFSGSTTYGRIVRQSLEVCAGELSVNVEVRSGQIACWFARAGAGVAIVDALTAAGQTFSMLVARPFRSTVQLEIRLLHDRYRPLSKHASEFCDAFDRLWKARLLQG